MKKNLNKFLYIFLAISILLMIFVRIRLLNIPLERDEGEYAYAGQLILKGIPPYSLAYNMKLPGIYYMYAAILAVFGQSIQAIHFGLLIVTLISIFIFFLICKKLFNPAIAAIACATYAILGLTSSIYGFSANAEPFVLLFILPAILIEIYALENHRTWLVFASGLFFGVAFLMKQHAAAFILFGGLWLLIELVNLKPFSVKKLLLFPAVFSTGVFLPYIITCSLMWKLGVFNQFWFWTVDYARQYVSQLSLKASAILFRANAVPIIQMTWPILIIAMIGLIASVRVKAIRKKKYFAAAFFVFSFLSVCPGLLFRQHYFIFMMPSIGLLCALGFYGIYILLLKTKVRFLPQAGLILILIFATGYPMAVQRDYIFTMTSDQIIKYCYGSNPFVESVEIAEYIKEHSNEDDLIAVFGSEPQIYFLF